MRYLKMIPSWIINPIELNGLCKVGKELLTLSLHPRKPRFIVGGLTEQGKSSLINMLCEKNVAAIGDGLYAQTLEPAIYSTDRVDVIDSRGLLEERNQVGAERKFKEALRKFFPDALLYVYKCNGDYAASIWKDAYEKVQSLITSELHEKIPTIVILTKLDEEPNSYAGFIDKHLTGEFNGDIQSWIEKRETFVAARIQTLMEEKFGKLSCPPDKMEMCATPADTSPDKKDRVQNPKRFQRRDQVVACINEVLPSNAILKRDAEDYFVHLGYIVISVFCIINGILSLVPGIDVIATIYTTKMMVKILSVFSLHDKTKKDFLNQYGTTYNLLAWARSLAMIGCCAFGALTAGIGIGLGLATGVLVAASITAVVGDKALAFFSGRDRSQSSMFQRYRVAFNRLKKITTHLESTAKQSS